MFMSLDFDSVNKIQKGFLSDIVQLSQRGQSTPQRSVPVSFSSLFHFLPTFLRDPRATLRAHWTRCTGPTPLPPHEPGPRLRQGCRTLYAPLIAMANPDPFSLYN